MADVACLGVRVALPQHALYTDDVSIAAPILLRGRVDVAMQRG